MSPYQIWIWRRRFIPGASSTLPDRCSRISPLGEDSVLCNTRSRTQQRFGPRRIWMNCKRRVIAAVALATLVTVGRAAATRRFQSTSPPPAAPAPVFFALASVSIHSREIPSSGPGKAVAIASLLAPPGLPSGLFDSGIQSSGFDLFLYLRGPRYVQLLLHASRWLLRNDRERDRRGRHPDPITNSDAVNYRARQCRPRCFFRPANYQY